MTSIIRFIIMIFSGISTPFIRTWQAFRRGKKEGVAEVRQEVTDRTLAVATEAKKAKNEVDALPTDDLKRRAGKWVRKPKSAHPHDDDK